MAGEPYTDSYNFLNLTRTCTIGNRGSLHLSGKCLQSEGEELCWWHLVNHRNQTRRNFLNSEACRQGRRLIFLMMLEAWELKCGKEYPGTKLFPTGILPQWSANPRAQGHFLAMQEGQTCGEQSHSEAVRDVQVHRTEGAPPFIKMELETNASRGTDGWCHPGVCRQLMSSRCVDSWLSQGHSLGLPDYERLWRPSGLSRSPPQPALQMKTWRSCVG